MRKTRIMALTLALVLSIGYCPGRVACAQTEGTAAISNKTYIEQELNLAENSEQEWTYVQGSDAWVLSVVSAVAYPELPDQQGVSVCVPGAYVKGVDIDKDGSVDVTSDAVSAAVKGALVIDYEAQITSTNGQAYTAATAPVIINTGAAGYGSQNNSAASTAHAADGYINVSCGNRGKQDTVTDENGNTRYTGDAPSCLVDQKAAVRYVKYNILLGNLPGDVDRFVSTGGSGGGAHAAMFAATSNHSDYYDYQIEAGAVGVYRNEDGSYSTSVTIDGVDYEISDGVWGCIAYSAITSLYEADMALAFEYYLDTDYTFKTSFQAKLAEYLSESYMTYINAQNISVSESDVGFDLDGDGAMDSTVVLTIQCDPEAYPETNGYHGTYLDLYLAEFKQNLQWYLENLDYAGDWTWFDAQGNALDDETVAQMTTEDKAQAFLEGRYAQSSSGKGAMMGGPGDIAGGPGAQMLGGMPGGDLPDGDLPDGVPGGKGGPDGNMMGGMGGPGEMSMGDLPSGELPDGMIVGTPDAGTTQSNTGSMDSANYQSYEEMVAAYKADVESVYAGDEYGNNIVALYNPLNYIGTEGVEDPVWTKIVMGASEGDISLFNSLNLQIAWLNAGVDAQIEWQWNGGHVPSEVLGDSFSLYVDQMFGQYVDGAATIEKPEAVPQTENGAAESATGTDISAWVSYDSENGAFFTLADAAAYRTAGASKAVPGFDVIDYGQEDYVFGNVEADARHWNTFLVDIFETYADALAPLFNND